MFVQIYMKPEARKLAHKTLEEMRVMAVKRISEGEHPTAVAVSLGRRCLNRRDSHFFSRLGAAALKQIRQNCMDTGYTRDAVGQASGPKTNMAKDSAGEVAFQEADRAVQTHGCVGYASESPVERNFGEARPSRIASIPEYLMSATFVEHVLGLLRSYGRCYGR
ncbi:acyl-CoA dehydrogenase family protein [Polaromonas hydrogenivorans]|uniref:Acyl-CoA dehydrogenase family protein n=1 Tax=Polaromonas hydrogenivorans TaxID=335476 RepID=A0AAU7M039_9BURK